MATHHNNVGFAECKTHWFRDHLQSTYLVVLHVGIACMTSTGMPTKTLLTRAVVDDFGDLVTVREFL